MCTMKFCWVRIALFALTHEARNSILQYFQEHMISTSISIKLSTQERAMLLLLYDVLKKGAKKAEVRCSHFISLLLCFGFSLCSCTYHYNGTSELSIDTCVEILRELYDHVWRWYLSEISHIYRLFVFILNSETK